LFDCGRAFEVVSSSVDSSVVVSSIMISSGLLVSGKVVEAGAFKENIIQAEESGAHPANKNFWVDFVIMVKYLLK